MAKKAKWPIIVWEGRYCPVADGPYTDARIVEDGKGNLFVEYLVKDAMGKDMWQNDDESRLAILEEAVFDLVRTPNRSPE